MTAITAPSSRLGLGARAAEPTDANFLSGLEFEAHGGAFSVLGFSPQANDLGWPSRDRGDSYIIERNGRSIGHLRLLRQRDELVVEDLRLLQSEWGRGAGSWALRGVMSEAVASEVPVTVRVRRTADRTRDILRHLGFRATGSDSMSVRFEWSPPLEPVEIDLTFG